MANHVLGNKYLVEDLAVVNKERKTHEFRYYCAGSDPAYPDQSAC